MFLNSVSSFSLPNPCQEADAAVCKRKIKGLKKLAASLEGTDKKLCLFMARTASEDLPKADNEVWVSLDSRPETKPCGRIHLPMSFKNQKMMAKIAQIFDKVVLDWSSLKFFDEDPWRAMAKLLKPHPDATLITEALNPQPANVVSEYTKRREDFGQAEILQSEIDQGDRIPQSYLQNLKASFSTTQWEERYQQWLTENPEYQDIAEVQKKASFEWDLIRQAQEKGELVIPDLWEEAEVGAKEAARQYLQTIFKSVELVESQPWPYPSNYASKKGYFILKNPIVE